MPTKKEMKEIRRHVRETDIITATEEGLDHKGEPMTRERLIDKLEQMPELEHEDELIHKAMNNLNTFQCCEGELYLRGTDEYGKDFQVVFDAYDFLNWIDSERVEYIKEQLIKHIKEK
jgi:hypothetical protein|tara:strand:+ start:903 stop:1256 length:354 start_codon:yes stop_codon:yes gene_type:complete